MYACICHAVSDDDVASALDAGADSISAVGELTYAGTSCGTCHDDLEYLIETRCGSCPGQARCVA